MLRKMISWRMQQMLRPWLQCKSSRSRMLQWQTANYTVKSTSQFVERLRFMQKLKEDEAVCKKFISEGYFTVFCNMKPLVSERGILWKSYSDIMKHSSTFRVSLLKDSVFVAVEELDSPPKFAINISPDDGAQSKEFEAQVSDVLGGRPCSIRKALFLLPQHAAATVSMAYSMLQWHSKTAFCSCCGQPTTKDTSGFKRTCSSCQETFYPSIQPIAITLVTSGDRCVLARQPRFPPMMYSALAGFVEPGESLEMAVQREVAEEVGLEVDHINYHDSQHWPFPSSGLMLGCFAKVKDGCSDMIDIDKTELEDAKWVTRGELKKMLKDESSSGMPGLIGGPDIYIPPPQAIANRLITSWTFEE